MENRKDFIREIIDHLQDYQFSLGTEAIECPDLYIDMQVIDLIVEDLNKVKVVNDNILKLGFTFSYNSEDKINFLEGLLFNTFECSALYEDCEYVSDKELQEDAYQYHLIYHCLLLYSNDLAFKINFFEINDDIQLFRNAAEYYLGRGGKNG